jgi:surface carbohydrate biosynthesis protein
LYYFLREKDGIREKMSMPNFLCFGQNDVDNYIKYGHTIDCFHIVGSLSGGFYKYGLKRIPEKNLFDICLVSQYRDGIFSDQMTFMVDIKFYIKFKNGYMILLEFLRKFIAENNLSFCVATANRSQKEYEFYRKIFGDRAVIIRQHEYDNLSTYEAMDASKVIVELDSTSGVEAFGWGKKVLFCNFTDDDTRNFHFEGICSINNTDYNIFKEKLTGLLTINDEQYQQSTLEQRKYMMNYNPELPAHVYMKNIIKGILEDGK